MSENWSQLSPWPTKLCGPFRSELNPKTTKFFVLDEHSHIEYMDYLKNCACV